MIRRLRKVALGLMLMLCALSAVGWVSVAKQAFRWSPSVEVVSAAGSLQFLKHPIKYLIPLKNGNLVETWHADVESAWLPKGYLGQFYSQFDWAHLGFHFELGSFRLIRIPYWPFILALGVPEIMTWRRRIQSLAHPTEQGAPQRVAASVVVADVPCAGCGYNLRTLAEGGQCPECGLAVEQTLSLNAELARSRPGWLARLAAGNILVLLARVTLAVELMVWWFARTASVFSDMRWVVLVPALYAMGIFYLTLPEHPFLKGADSRRIPIQRAMALLVLLLSILFALSIGGRWLGMNWAGLLLTAVTLLYCVCVSGEYRYLARLAGRLLDNFMIEHCIIAGTGAAVANYLLLFIFAAMISAWNFPASLATFLAFIAVLVGWLLFTIWTGFMNFYCAVRFLEQAKIARRQVRERTAAAPQI